MKPRPPTLAECLELVGMIRACGIKHPTLDNPVRAAAWGMTPEQVAQTMQMLFVHSGITAEQALVGTLAYLAEPDPGPLMCKAWPTVGHIRHRVLQLATTPARALEA